MSTTVRGLARFSPTCLLNLAPEAIGGRRRIAHNTWVERTADKGVAVIFHATPILTYDLAMGTVEVNSGGYRTSTTKQRLNALLPQHLRVHQQDFTWHVSDYRTGVRCEFEDGDIFDV